MGRMGVPFDAVRTRRAPPAQLSHPGAIVVQPRLSSATVALWILLVFVEESLKIWCHFGKFKDQARPESNATRWEGGPKTLIQHAGGGVAQHAGSSDPQQLF